MTESTALPETTLQTLFSVRAVSLQAGLTTSLSQSPEALGKEELHHWKKITQTPHFAEAVAEHVCGFLAASVPGILVGAWRTLHDVREAGDKTLADPSLHSEIALYDHEFSYALTPSLDVLAAGIKVCEILFGITAAFTVHGLELSIRHGCVDAVRSGKADCSLTITCSGSKILSKQSAAVNLPGIFTLAKPLLVARAQSRTQPAPLAEKKVDSREPSAAPISAG